jgi:hypothetical protein
MRDGDCGRIEEGFYTVTVDDNKDVVTLTNEAGAPIVTGRLQTKYSAALRDGENHVDVARRLISRRYMAEKKGGDFWRPLHYPGGPRVA